jgi:dTDP-6-deoxy-L-talose 4-dehydrogenase (NAD+)
VQSKVTGIINCCSGLPISIRKLVEEYIKEKGSNIKLNLGHYPYATDEPLAFWGDTCKMKMALGKQ